MSKAWKPFYFVNCRKLRLMSFRHRRHTSSHFKFLTSEQVLTEKFVPIPIEVRFHTPLKLKFRILSSNPVENRHTHLKQFPLKHSSEKHLECRTPNPLPWDFCGWQGPLVN